MKALSSAVLVLALLLSPAPAAGSTHAPPADTAPTHAAAVVEPEQQRLLVKVRDGADEAALADLLDTPGVRRVGDIDALGVVVVEASGSVAGAARRLEASPVVVYVEPDHGVQAVARVPNDPIFPHQWGLARINAPAAWSSTVGAPAVTVAVLDTGVDAAHEDLAGGVLPGHDFVDGDNDPRDQNGHGTLSAGIAAARTDNGRGIAGVCWTCRVLPVRVLDDVGQGTVASVSAGVRYAADEGAQVITLSLGTTQTSSTLALAIDYAVERGSLVVASSGNAGTTGRIYPAAYDNVLAVAASDEHDRRYSWSTYGTWVSLTAPGCNLSTRPGPERYAVYCGTSSAAPVVAGVAGLAFARHPTASSADVLAALRSSARSVTFVADGRVDAAGTLTALQETMGDAGAEPVRGDRYAGSDRYETAARASADTFPAGTSTVYVATGEAFADALAAGPAAAAATGPVLLTANAKLPAATEQELKRLAPREIIVVGGATAVEDGVLTRIRDVTGVQPVRVAGADRFATAAAVALRAFDSRVQVAYVATGSGFADALSGTPAAAVDGAPLLLTRPDRLPDATRDALAALRPDEVVVLGGPAAVSHAVAEALAEIGRVTRIAGSNRYETAARVAARAYPGAADVAALTTGANFPDALAGGPVAAHLGGPLLLVHRDALPEGAAAILKRAAPPRVLALGGASVIAEETLDAAVEAAMLGR